MKNIFLSLLLLFWLSWISWAQENTDLSCYTQEYTQNLFGSSRDILIETKTQDFLAIQGGEILSPINVWEAYKYIPFTSSLSWKSLDTQENKTIELTIDDLSTNNFEIDFRHDATYHTPKYYISEDGETYSQVTARNIADFRIYKVRIEFVSTTKEEIREIINIDSLTIERKNYISSLDLSSAANIHFYFNNSCSNKKNEFPKSNQLVVDAPIYDILKPETHNLYIRKTTDSDNDNIMDLYDNCISVKNSDQKDINQNSVWDACEFDTDNDTVPDEIDNCRNTSNLTQEDTDKDGIGNSCDNCKLYNPSQRDEDGNKIWDTCDLQETFLKNNDDDSDGVLNSVDNCEQVANPNQADSDSDRIGNACDNCKTFQNYNQEDINKNGIGDICEDADSDGIDSITDNCINVANPDQADDDNDGIWNICEDDDNDNVVFNRDNCPYKYNPDQLDTDSDGSWDVCDSDDDRFLESNKPIFILLMLLIITWFIGAIVMMARKLQK